MGAEEEGRTTMDTMDDYLDNLQAEAEKLVSLLKEREIGHISWWDFLSVRLTNIRTLASRIIGPEK